MSTETSTALNAWTPQLTRHSLSEQGPPRATGFQERNMSHCCCYCKEPSLILMLLLSDDISSMLLVIHWQGNAPVTLPSRTTIRTKQSEIQLWCTTKSSSWVKAQKSRTFLMAPSNNKHCWIFQLKWSRCLETALTFLIISLKHIFQKLRKRRNKNKRQWLNNKFVAVSGCLVFCLHS